MSRGRPMSERPSGPGTALANFLIDRLGDPELGLTHQQLAERLGYARPNIVSSWKTARAKFTLDHVWEMADILKIDPSYMLALYIDQYVSGGHRGVDHFEDIARTLTRLCTEEEWEIIKEVRKARRNNSLPLDDKQRSILSSAFAVAADMPEGDYAPVDDIRKLVLKDSDRRRFRRRGKPRNMTVDEAEEMDLRRAKRDDAALKKVPSAPKKTSAAAKRAKAPA